MKVPPHKPLIVCAKPPQTIVRQCVLAAVSYVSALCGAASAQSAPAAPPLEVTDAVELSYETTQENLYTLERSASLSSWLPGTAPLFGNGGEAAQTFALSGAGSDFFRLRVDTRPVIGTAPWQIADTILLFNNSAGSPFSLIFNGHGGGVLLRGAASEDFTWEWLRTGLDSGVCALVHQSGEVEMIEMNYVAGGIGAFSSQRTRAGFPTGASSGTFRSVADSSLTTFMPNNLGHSLVTLSGSGRPAGIEVKTDGTAAVAGPTGVRTANCAYSLKTTQTAELKLSGTVLTSETYVLTFTGPSCGTYTGLTYRYNLPRRTSSGTFTITPL